MTRLLAAALTLAAAVAFAAPAHASTDPAMPTLYVVDHTDGLWSVPAAVALWDRAPNVNVRMATDCDAVGVTADTVHETSVVPPVSCVVITNYWAPYQTDTYGAGWIGVTYTSFPRVPLLRAELNSWWEHQQRDIYGGLPKAERAARGMLWRQSIVCHEIGHALGLQHNGRGCMREWVGPRRADLRPGAANLADAR